MSNQEKDKSAGQNAVELLVSANAIMISSFGGISGVTDTTRAKVIFGVVGNSFGVMTDIADGRSPAEITGRLFGTAIDFALLKKATNKIYIPASIKKFKSFSVF